MRIAPNHPRLRIVALASWITGAWWIIQLGSISSALASQLLTVAMSLVAIFLFAVGVTFWLLAHDRRAGVILDSKGVALNLGHSAAFIAWDNIAAIGVSRHRANLLAVGSARQLGIRLNDPRSYLQSYESRLPAARGLIASSMRLLSQAVGPLSRSEALPDLPALARLRARTGYDVLIPESQLGGKAAAFAALIESYRLDPELRRALAAGGATSSRAG